MEKAKISAENFDQNLIALMDKLNSLVNHQDITSGMYLGAEKLKHQQLKKDTVYIIVIIVINMLKFFLIAPIVGIRYGRSEKDGGISDREMCS